MCLHIRTSGLFGTVETGAVRRLIFGGSAKSHLFTTSGNQLSKRIGRRSGLTLDMSTATSNLSDFRCHPKSRVATVLESSVRVKTNMPPS